MSESDEDDIPELVVLEENEPVDQKPCPVTILSGFLGSGKTTLIQYILRSPDHGKRIAVIENEYGDGLAVESMIARDGAQSLADLIELPNGCVCCTVKDSLVATLENLLTKRSDLDYILIECSGMANPGPIASLFWLDDALGSRLRLDSIVTLVDAAHIGQQLEATLEAAQQLAYADRIILNKMDLVSAEDLQEVEARIQRLCPLVPMRKTQQAQIPDLDWILDARCFDSDRAMRIQQDVDTPEGVMFCQVCDKTDEPPHLHTDTIGTLSFVIPGSLDLDRLHQWLAEILWPNQDERNDVLQEAVATGHIVSSSDTESHIFRMKGILSVASHSDSRLDTTEYLDEQRVDRRRYILQVVHDLWEVHPGLDLKWNEDEHRQSKVVVIGKHLKAGELRDGLHSCVFDPCS